MFSWSIAYYYSNYFMKKNSKHTLDTIKKMSVSHKGCISWSKGKKFSDEYRLKISIGTKKAMANLSPEKRALMNPTGIHRSPSTEFKKGRKLSQNEKIEISNRCKKFGIGNWMIGRIPPFIKQGNHFQYSKGEKHPFWKGGITPLYNIIRNSFEDNLWRKNIFQRDNYTCQECFKIGGKLEAHHIKEFAKILQEFLKEYSQFSPIEDKETLVRLAITYKPFWDIANGKTLCKDCHIKTFAGAPLS